MRVWLLGSGSSGNAAIVESSGGRLLVDAGMGPKKAADRMRALGGELFPRGVDGIVVTHDHGDHAAHLEPLARALRAPVFLHDGIPAERVRRRYDVRAYERGGSFRVGPFEVASFIIPHDAPQVALRVGAGGLRFGIATDLGHVPRGLDRFLGLSDEVLLEANYCPELLRDGPYPQSLKKRVTGGLGHLSNAEAAALAQALSPSRVRRLWLGHLSLVNNTSARALFEVREKAPLLETEVISHGIPQLLEVRAGWMGRGHAEQMALPFS
jgi:phosphoribosyl 1,2-cyclic phosphodiesterase